MPIVTREEFYFEPRVVNDNGKIRWYGEEYSNSAILEKIEYTVYIRDNGEELFIYELYFDDERDSETNKIYCTFNLITQIKKHSNKFIYGRLRK